MKKNGLNKMIRKLRLRFGSWILPRMSRTNVEDIAIMNLSISSYSKSDLIPREHYEKVWMEIFKLTEDNVIFNVRGFKKGKIFETKIYYSSKKLLFKDKNK